METVTLSRRDTGVSPSPALIQELDLHCALGHKASAWRSAEAVSASDGRVWLEDSLADSDGRVLRVDLPGQTRLAEQIRYRLDWRNQQGHEQDERGFATLLSNSGRQCRSVSLNTSAEKIKAATYWKLWVQVILAPPRPELDSSDFQNRAGENTEVLILHPAAALAGRGTSEFQACFYSDMPATASAATAVAVDHFAQFSLHFQVLAAYRGVLQRGGFFAHPLVLRLVVRLANRAALSVGRILHHHSLLSSQTNHMIDNLAKTNSPKRPRKMKTNRDQAAAIARDTAEASGRSNPSPHER